MKNYKLNLIKGLWDDSHEKQKPQRFGRYAAMLIMLLTLGVGQMWAGQGYNGESHVYLNVDGTTKYYKVSTESWSTGSSLPGTWGGVLKDQTFSNIHTLEIKGGAVGGWTENGGNISGNLYYKVTNNTTTPSSGWTTVGGINANYTTKSGNNCFRYKNDYSVNVTPTTPGTYYLHIKITDGDSNNRTSYVKFTIPSYTVAGSSAVLGTNWDQTDTDNDMVWSSGTTYTLTKSNVVLTKDNTYEYKVAYNHAWTTAYPASNASIDFGNTTGHYDVTFTFNASTHAVSATATRLYAVSYNDNSSTSGSVPATTYHANGATVTVASNSGSLAKSGYSFGGWNTEANGSGTNYTAGSGTFTMGSADKPLYAKWTENMSTVSFVADPSGKGTFQVGGATVTSTTAGVSTTRSVTAVAADGYHWTGWSITGGATISSSSTNPTTVTGGGAGTAATLTATFAADATNTLTVTATTGGSITTPAAGYYSDITTTGYSIAASRSEGYKFTGWTKTAGDGAVSFSDASSLSTTATITTLGDVTVTAGFAAMSNSLSVSSSTLYAGDNITLSATRTNHSLNLTYQYKIGDGSWTDIATQSGTSKTWQIPYANTYQTYKFRVKSTDGSTSFYSAEQTVNVKGCIIIHVKNTNSWGSMYLYSWYSSTETNGSWPGTTGSGSNGQSCSVHATGSQWWDVTITQETANAQKFILNKNGSNNQDKTDDLLLSNFTHDAYYTMSTNGSAVQTLSTTTTPSAPTLSTSAASSIAATSATLGGNVTNLGNDIISERGYYWSTSSTLSSSNLSVGTKVTVSGTQSSTGTFSNSKTGLTNGTTYYIIAYAKNGYGTSYGAVNNFRTKFITTVTLNMQGGSDGTSEVTATEGSAMPSGKTAPGKTGYTFGGYYASAGGSGKQYYTSSMSSANNWDVAASTATIHAKWTPITYTIHFNGNGSTSGSMSNQTGVTYDAATTITSNAFGRTGYNFGGWATTQERANAGTVDRADGAAHGNLASTQGATAQLWAVWTPKQSALTFDYQTTATGYGSSGSISAVSATYDAEMPTLSGSMPTAANGYAFMGFYDATGGSGTQYYDGTGVSVTNWDKDTESETTLYAYYKKAEVTGITFSPAAIVATNATVTATPTISPTPTGTTAVCWELQYSNGTRVPSQPTFTPGVGNAVSFTAPSTSATYRLQAVLHLDDCNGDELSVYSETFQVAGEHTVTVRYQDSDGRTLAASTEITGRPLTWTTAGDITPPTITGYTFARWDAGDGVTIKNGDSDPVTTTTTSSIQIKAVYDGTLTAVYTKKRMIYFYNTLGWGSVYVYFYKNDSYWQTVSPYKGSGSKTTSTWTDTPYELGKHGQMLPVSEGSNIYYFDAEGEGVPSSYDDVVFTEHNQHDYEFFWKTNAVRRGDYKTTMPMFVPLADQTADVHNETNYYNSGYWMNYPENSGYTLKIYNAYDATKETAAVQSIAFPYSEDLKMPLKLDVELSDGYNHNYWFMVYRNDGTYMGSEYYFKQGYQSEQTITGGNNKNKITTSAPGNYTFTLTYHDNGSGTNNYYIDVDFPIATGDYRIVYKDNAAWSHGTHGASWCHPSHSIGKATTEAKKDTVSFFISKAVGITPSMKFQKASVTNEGVVTWADVAGGSITIPSSVTETGVYNFIVSQPAGGASISLEKVEPYTGNFYIRTDCAGNTKWDSFKNVDHQMTYSDYAEDNSGYSHYFVHWVENGNNVKFTIANDYSMCITDTLVEDYGTTIANISNIGVLNSGNASIRFMWNQATNKISRAYISGSSNVADRFLVLEGDARMYDESGNALSISGLNANEINLVDDQNFVYERTIQVKTTARAKLTAKYNNNVQYFKGSSGDFAEGTTIQLLGGEASDTKHTMRIVYDFKTNRLVTAYVPSGTIESDLAINADLMIVREHQNAGQQLLFNGGSLSDVHTVYGVMRFNKWTLNNKETTGGHSIVGDPKSAYERSVFWISFPFDVKLSDVFGFGTYGVDWIIEYYDGTARAAEGYWADSKGFWKYVMPSQRSTYELKAGKGYALVLDLARMKDDNGDFWPNSIEQVELFFPSTGNVGGIEATNVTTTAESHLYDAAAHPGHTDDRTYKDSHWNMIGVPSYANYGTTLTSDGSTTITWSTPVESDLPYLYEWNAVDNTYTAQTGSTYPFKSMHSYMVQYHGSLHWSLASATPVTPIVARRTYAEKPQNVELRLELSQNEKMIDQTFVKLSNDEEVSAAFKFDEDLSKEMNKNKANIYTMIADLSVAGNTMPMSEQTTVVPVGVKIAADGDYTFAIPDGTEGIGVTLVDTETGVRTSLSALDYTVNLSAGTYNERFVLEISPIKQTPTGIENSEVSHQHSDTRKVLIDGILYIVKDGKMFDARGAVVK